MINSINCFDNNKLKPVSTRLTYLIKGEYYKHKDFYIFMFICESEKCHCGYELQAFKGRVKNNRVLLSLILTNDLFLGKEFQEFNMKKHIEDWKPVLNHEAKIPVPCEYDYFLDEEVIKKVFGTINLDEM